MQELICPTYISRTGTDRIYRRSSSSLELPFMSYLKSRTGTDRIYGRFYGSSAPAKSKVPFMDLRLRPSVIDGSFLTRPVSTASTTVIVLH